jgi:hypothetical protein
VASVWSGDGPRIPKDSRAAAVQPLDANGQPSASGRYALLSIGMSNTKQEFCSQPSTEPCDAWTFVGKAGCIPA